MTTALHPPHADMAHDGRTHRVAVREIREAAWRALYAAGASAGEASVAASAVAFTEVLSGSGLQALLAELPTVPSARTPVGVRSSNAVDVLDDPASRGLLLLAPLGVGLVVARPLSPPVLLPGVAWHPVLAGLLAPHCGVAEPALVALEIDADGNSIQGLRVWPDRSVELLGPQNNDQLQHVHVRSGQAKASIGGGVLLTTAPGRAATGRPVTFAAETVAARQQQAYADGVLVDSDLWSAVETAAGRYLVAER
jgi:hypothetical protein